MKTNAMRIRSARSLVRNSAADCYATRTAPVSPATFLMCATAAMAPVVLVSKSSVASSSSATGISDWSR